MSTAHGGEAATQGSASPAATQLLPGGSFYEHGHEVTDGFVSELVPRGVHDLPHRVGRHVGNRATRRRMRSSTARTSLSEGACKLVIMSPILLLRDQGRTITSSEAGAVVGGGPPVDG